MPLPFLRVLLPMLLLLPCVTLAAGEWVTVVHDGAREVQFDRGGVIRSDAGTRVAWARMVLPAADAAVEGYTTLLALNRYDCRNRSFSTVRRRYLDASHGILREEEVRDRSWRAVVPGGVDERLWREACRPPSAGDLVKLAEEAERAAAALLAVSDQPEVPAPAAASPARGQSSAGPRPAALQSAAEVRHRPPAAPSIPLQQQEPYAPRHPGIAWSYEGVTGPELWGRLRPDWELCARGERQSPTPLDAAMQVALEPLEFDYRESFFRVMDAGQLLRIQVGEGLAARIRGERYELTHIDLHRPGESHVDGRSFDLSAELHHRAADGRMAVVSVQFQAGTRPHPVLQSWLGSLPLERGGQYAPDFAVDVQALIPPERGYILYSGSLSVPPCTEGVTRVVMKAPLEMSWEQLGVLARLHPPNARPLQPLKGRIVLESR